MPNRPGNCASAGVLKALASDEGAPWQQVGGTIGNGGGSWRSWKTIGKPEENCGFMVVYWDFNDDLPSGNVT